MDRKTKLELILIIATFIAYALLFAPSVQITSAATTTQFPDEICARILSIINLPGRYSYAITTSGGIYFTDASRGYWGAGIGKFCCFMERGRSGIYDCHCSP